MACGSGTLHDPRNETADAGRHGFPDSCGIGVSAGYGIVDCIADSAAASIRSRKEQSSHFGGCGVMGASVIAFAELVKTNVLSAFSFLNQMNGWILAGIAVVVTVLLILLSYAISVRIMEKKEF